MEKDEPPQLEAHPEVSDEEDVLIAEYAEIKRLEGVFEIHPPCREHWFQQWTCGSPCLRCGRTPITLIQK